MSKTILKSFLAVICTTTPLYPMNIVKTMAQLCAGTSLGVLGLKLSARAENKALKYSTKEIRTPIPLEESEKYELIREKTNPLLYTAAPLANPITHIGYSLGLLKSWQIARNVWPVGRHVSQNGITFVDVKRLIPTNPKEFWSGLKTLTLPKGPFPGWLKWTAGIGFLSSAIKCIPLEHQFTDGNKADTPIHRALYKALPAHDFEVRKKE